MRPTKRFRNQKMRWLPKGIAPVIIEPTIAQGLIFGQTAIGEISLRDNLTHMWGMGESGTRVDKVGSLDLIKYNSPTVVSGRVANATRFPEAVSSHLYANGSRINPGNHNFHLLFWIRWFRTNELGEINIVYEYYDEPTGAAYRLWYSATSGYYRWSCGGGNPWKTAARVQDAWVMVDAFFNTQTNLSGIALNNGTHVTAAATSSPSTATTNEDFIISATSTGVGFSDSFDIDAFHVWEDYNLTTAERTYMYNSGNGRELV